MQEYASLLWIVAIAVIFWLLIIRPTQKRQKTMQRMQSSLNVGDEIVLTSGVFGTIVEITDDDLRVEIAPGVRIRIVRGAVGNKVERETERPADESGETDETGPSDESSRPEQGEN